MKNKLLKQDFCTIIKHAPLVSIDLCILHQSKILLGKRLNAPAKNYYFTPGGRVYKNEPWQDAIERIANDEVGLDVKAKEFQLMGVWDHFYTDSVFDEHSPTHYVNLPHLLQLEKAPYVRADEQHEKLAWFDLYHNKNNQLIHPYTQNYLQWLLENLTVTRCGESEI